jgi:hypothetical protein
MSGWNSLDSVGTTHILLQLSGVLIAAIVIAAGMTTYHFWSRWSDLVAIADRTRNQYLPRWRADAAATVHNTLIEVALLGIAALLALGYAAFAYGQRKTELVAATHAAGLAKVRTESETLRRALAERDARATNALALRQSMREAEVRHLAEAAALRREIEQMQKRRAIAQPDRETESRLTAEIATLHRASDQTAKRHAAEIAELQGRLWQTESRRVASVESLRWEVKQAETKAATEIARLERALQKTERKLVSLTTHRRLSIEEKYAMIDALRPFAGQKVTIAAIEGDEDGRSYAADFAEVFEAAGWEHPEIAYRRWDRDPVGVEITLNEADGRAGRVNVAVGALINITRKLSLTDGNTIYMNGEVPAGQVQLKIGKKLPR